MVLSLQEICYQQLNLSQKRQLYDILPDTFTKIIRKPSARLTIFNAILQHYCKKKLYNETSIKSDFLYFVSLLENGYTLHCTQIMFDSDYHTSNWISFEKRINHIDGKASYMKRLYNMMRNTSGHIVITRKEAFDFIRRALSECKCFKRNLFIVI